jgi:hypothetical protein
MVEKLKISIDISFKVFSIKQLLKLEEIQSSQQTMKLPLKFFSDNNY